MDDRRSCSIAELVGAVNLSQRSTPPSNRPRHNRPDQIPLPINLDHHLLVGEVALVPEEGQRIQVAFRERVLQDRQLLRFRRRFVGFVSVISLEAA